MLACLRNQDWISIVNNRRQDVARAHRVGRRSVASIYRPTKHMWLFTIRAASILSLITLVILSHAQALRAATFQLPQLPQVPGLSGKSADWRQWDSFYTFVVKRFGQDLPENLKDPLGGAFLDSRYELTSAVAPGKGGDPVPQLFVNGWKRLSPIMNQALPVLPKQTASLYSNFIGAADKLAATGPTGVQSGIVSLSPDVLTGMARIIQPTGGAESSCLYNRRRFESSHTAWIWRVRGQAESVGSPLLPRGAGSIAPWFVARPSRVRGRVACGQGQPVGGARWQ